MARHTASMQRIHAAFPLLFIVFAGCGRAPQEEAEDESALIRPYVRGDFYYDATYTFCARPTPSSRSYMNFYGGHYIGAGQGAFEDTLREIKEKGQLVGVQKKYFWRDLHVGRYKFNVDEIYDDIQKAKEANKKLSIFILYKYKSTGGAVPIPSYLEEQNTPEYPTYRALTGGGDAGYLAAMDHNGVRDAFIRFLKALAFKFQANTPGSDWDKHVAFIQFTETAPGMDLGESKAAFFENLRIMNQQASCIFKHTPIVQNTNFPPGELLALTDNYRNWGVAMGATDIWLDDPSVDADNKVYDYYHRVTYDTGIAATVAINNLRVPNHAEELKLKHGEPYESNTTRFGLDTPQEVVEVVAAKASEPASTSRVEDFAHGVDGYTLGANYIVWRRAGATDPYYRVLLNEPLPALDAGCPLAWGRNDFERGVGTYCTEEDAALF
jgi:hypothetical protein